MILRVGTLLLLAASSLGTQIQEEPLYEDRIVGGEDVDTMDKYPYHLSLHLQGVYHCGAIIISDLWALTAAQCADGAIADMKLRAGSARLDSGGTLHNVTEKIVHINYDPENSDYDIALLQVDPPFNFSNEIYNVKAVVLPEATDADPTDRIDLSVTGWGVTTPDGVGASTLQVVFVRVVDRDLCKEAYVPTVVTSRMICAGNYTDGGVDSCQGDSGGAMVVRGTYPALLVGIVSWGRGCALPGFPGVYVRVTAMRDWIFNNSGV